MGPLGNKSNLSLTTAQFGPSEKPIPNLLPNDNSNVIVEVWRWIIGPRGGFEPKHPCRASNHVRTRLACPKIPANCLSTVRPKLIETFIKDQQVGMGFIKVMRIRQLCCVVNWKPTCIEISSNVILRSLLKLEMWYKSVTRRWAVWRHLKNKFKPFVIHVC